MTTAGLTGPAHHGESMKTRPASRNPGTMLDVPWVRRMRVDHAALEARVARLESATVPPKRRIALLLRAVDCLDLTTLAEDDTTERVRAVCAQARLPLGPAVTRALAAAGPGRRVAAVCIYPRFVPVARAALDGSGIPVAVVAADFPHGRGPVAGRLAEIRGTVNAGAEEIDAVIPREHVLSGDWRRLYDEVRAYREACGAATFKAILAAGTLGSLENVARASAVCLMAGADFIKTSTGREPVNATLPIGVVMARVIRAYRRRTGRRAGLKPAGGIRTAEQALAWTLLVTGELGDRWLGPTWFRIGASALLDAIQRELTRSIVDGEAAAPGGANA
jgi:deoxyribose-phosphate aldolase